MLKGKNIGKNADIKANSPLDINIGLWRKGENIIFQKGEWFKNNI
jgi:hypothetical protein